MKRKLYYPVLSAAICAGMLFPAVGASAATDPARACYSDYLNRNLVTRYNSYGYDIVDINGDGTPEICLRDGRWEWGYYYVMARDQDGTWQRVLQANYGT